MLYFNKGAKVKEYLLEISKMSYSNMNSEIWLELKDISSVDEEYAAYSETVHGFENGYSRICFSANKKIIIKRKD